MSVSASPESLVNASNSALIRVKYANKWRYFSTCDQNENWAIAPMRRAEAEAPLKLRRRPMSISAPT